MIKATTVDANAKCRLDDLFGYDILIAPGILGNPPPDGYTIRVRRSGVTVERVPPSIRVVGL